MFNPASLAPGSARVFSFVSSSLATSDPARPQASALVPAAVLTMLMLAGFALVETGLCRAKNAAYAMSLNFLVYPLAVVGFFVCGFAFAFGGAGDPRVAGVAPLGAIPSLGRMLTVGSGHPWGILGFKGFFLAGGSDAVPAATWFFFAAPFMSIAASIPTGALIERWRFKSFFVFCLLMGAVVFPVYACWVWGGGWLAQLGVYARLGHGAVDYAGASVVHLLGGTVGLIATLLLGPRIGKYDDEGSPRPILGHHVPMVVLGTLLVAFGWFGFNTARSFASADGRAGLIAANTLLASASGALAAGLCIAAMYGKPDPSVMCNGMLAGLVAISASCAFVAPWAAFFIGAVAGVFVVAGVLLLERSGIDDLVGAVSVHGLNGLWGMLALGLFADGTFGNGYNGVGGNVAGLFYGGGARQLLCQLIAAGVCILWSLAAGGGFFLLIGRLVHTNRVSPEVEIAGLDIPETGAPGYPEFVSRVAPEQVGASDIAAASYRVE